MRTFLVLTAIAVFAAPMATARSYQASNGAVLRALDKITGRSTDIEVSTNEPIIFGSLLVTVEACFRTPPEEPPESAAFVSIYSVPTSAASTASGIIRQGDDGFSAEGAETRFSGWMFASSPGLNALEHSVYDVWVISCSAPSPVEGAVSE